MVQMLGNEGLRRRRCCATARLIFKLCDANNGAPQICRHIVQMLVGGETQICRYRHMLQMLNVCDASDGAPQICRYRHMVQVLVYEGLRRRRCCATANSSPNSAPQTTVQHRHMLQMLNVCDTNDRAKQICTYRHMLKMLVYEGLRHRR